MDAQWHANPEPRRYEPWQVEEQVLVAVAEERQFLAAELHDSIGGTLTGVAMGLAALRRALPDAKSREQLALLARALDQGISEVRTLSFGLQLPWCEPGTSLESAMAQFATGFGRRTGLRVTLDIAAPSGVLENGPTLALMRVLQEALLNVYRHANAQSVSVSFTCNREAAMLVVKDDGCGMNLVEGAPPTGAGLVAMRARVKRVGGVLRIESGPAGTTVSACMATGGAAASCQDD